MVAMRLNIVVRQPQVSPETHISCWPFREHRSEDSFQSNDAKLREPLELVGGVHHRARNISSSDTSPGRPPRRNFASRYGKAQVTFPLTSFP
jgi:hypothetical protein